jgi:hypothetical protein
MLTSFLPPLETAALTYSTLTISQLYPQILLIRVGKEKARPQGRACFDRNRRVKPGDDAGG